jgi:hypothetical protein
MPCEVRATILLEVDGVALPDFPIIRRYIVNELANLGDLVAAPDSNTSTFHAIPAAVMATLGIFFVAPDQAINLKINQNTPLPINANGLVLIMGAALAQGTPNTNVQVNNPSSSISANLPIIVAGS